MATSLSSAIISFSVSVISVASSARRSVSLPPESDTSSSDAQWISSSITLPPPSARLRVAAPDDVSILSRTGAESGTNAMNAHGPASATRKIR